MGARPKKQLEAKRTWQGYHLFHTMGQINFSLSSGKFMAPKPNNLKKKKRGFRVTITYYLLID